MAGMEIFGWLTFALTLAYAIRNPKEDPIHAKDLDPYLPWKACLALLVITVLGVFINGTEKVETVYDIGSQRWMFLLASSSFALTLSPPGRRGYQVFLFFISVTAVYGVFQSITGIDLLRPGEHRAVQPLFGPYPPWRTAGWFGSPLHYGYIAGQHVCLPLAVCLLTYKNRTKLFWPSLIAVVLVGASLVTTFTRGAWVAMAIAWLIMAFIAAPRLAGALAAAGAMATAALVGVFPSFRERLLTLVNPAYASNSERWFLWKANWEMFKDYPILGIGYSENENRAKEYVTRLGNPDAFTGHAHNNYLQFLAGTGLTGFIAYMFIISFMLWITWRLYKSLPAQAIWARAIALGALGAQIHLHIGGFTECNFKAGVTSHNTMMVWALVISMSVLNAKKRLPQVAL